MYVATADSAVATYIEYSMLNHMCKPNCGWEEENGAVFVFALEDIEAGEQLGISYLLPEYCLYVREVRRKELMDVFGFNCRCHVCLGEEITGSEYWLLDQQKRSLITPWSHQMIRDVMERAWEMVRPHRFFVLPPEEIAKILEQEIKVQKLCLEKSNVVLILTARTLIAKYSEVGEIEKAIDRFISVGESGMCTLLQYGTVLDATEIVDMIGMLCLQLGRMEECQQMAQLMQRLLPKRPSEESFCELLGSKCTKQNKQTVKKLKSGSEIVRDDAGEKPDSGSFNFPNGVNSDVFRSAFQHFGANQ